MMDAYKIFFAAIVTIGGLGGVLDTPLHASEPNGQPAMYEYYDIDGDGHKDRLSVKRDGAGNFEAYVGRNNGRGSYASTELLLTLGKAPLKAFILDYDRDGDMDFLFVYPVVDIYHDSGNYLAKNDGKGNFDSIEHLPRDY